MSIVYSYGERQCKVIADTYFKTSFRSSVRDLKWLMNVTGHPLEIDIYSDSLKLGIEYNGEQHYKFTPVFHETYDKFKLQTHRDAIKQMLCKENGVYLITVPYNCNDINTFLISRFKDYETHILYQKLQEHRRSELRRTNFKLQAQIDTNSVNEDISLTPRGKRAMIRDIKKRKMTPS
jgi:hypothetical protein